MNIKKLLTALLLSFSLCSQASADVLYKRIVLMSDAVQASSTNGTITSFPDSGMPSNVKGFACRAVLSNVSGTLPTADLKVQTCADSTAASCDDLCTFTQCTTGTCWTDGSQTVDKGNATNIYPKFRAVSTLGGTLPVYNVLVEVWYAQ